jgi:Zn ribbon nucleic-acid-binding protein
MKFNDLNLSTLIVHGVCPYCREVTPLVSIEENIYKCVNCGDEVEQYVNGVIKYLPTTRKGKKQLYGTKS